MKILRIDIPTLREIFSLVFFFLWRKPPEPYASTSSRSMASASEFDGAKYLAGENTHLGMSVSDLVSMSDWTAPQPSASEGSGMHAIYFIGDITI